MKTFRLKNPSIYLDYENWSAGFARFYEASMLMYKLETLGDLFSDINTYELKLIDTALAQLLALKKLTNKLNLNRYLRSESDEFRLLIKERSNHILTQTITKLRILKDNLEPDGFEILKREPYKTYKARSIESRGLHRIIYNINELPYRVTITSILGHYEDSPEDKFNGLECKIETCILDMYKLLSTKFVKSDYDEIRKYLGEKLNN